MIKHFTKITIHNEINVSNSLSPFLIENSDIGNVNAQINIPMKKNVLIMLWLKVAILYLNSIITILVLFFFKLIIIL